MTSAIPLISAMPQFSESAKAPDSLAAASPIFQALLSQSGGPQGLQDVNSLASAQPQFAPALSLMSPGGGLNPQQASQFGPLFGLLMSLFGGGQQQPTPGMGL
jgi:hypothetical protein